MSESYSVYYREGFETAEVGMGNSVTRNGRLDIVDILKNERSLGQIVWEHEAQKIKFFKGKKTGKLSLLDAFKLLINFINTKYSDWKDGSDRPHNIFPKESLTVDNKGNNLRYSLKKYKGDGRFGPIYKRVFIYIVNLVHFLKRCYE